MRGFIRHRNSLCGFPAHLLPIKVGPPSSSELLAVWLTLVWLLLSLEELLLELSYHCAAFGHGPEAFGCCPTTVALRQRNSTLYTLGIPLNRFTAAAGTVDGSASCFTSKRWRIAKIITCFGGYQAAGATRLLDPWCNPSETHPREIE